MTTLRQLIDWYKAGFRYVARASEADKWHPCRSKSEAQHDSGRAGDAMAIQELVALLVTGGLPCPPNPRVNCDENIFDTMSLDDVILAMKLTKRVAKRCERIA